jgi:hypothetical protein
MRKFIILILLLAALSCHERVNPYDPGSENFTTPPPIYLAYPIGGWYNQYGYLIGVRIQVEFVDEFLVAMSILNVLTSSTSVMASESVVVPGGRDSYIVDLIGDSAMPAGDYLVVFYWNDMSIGSCFFGVVQRNGDYVIPNVEEYDTLNTGY